MSTGRGARILVVDDDADVRGVAASALVAEGYEVIEVASAMEAFAYLEEAPPDLVVLDVVMPGISGLEVLDHIRSEHPSLPVILLSGLGADENIVRGLRLGAEDYMVKPVSPKVLVARVERTLMRQREGVGRSELIVLGDMTIDIDAHEVRCNGELIDLTAKEFDLLAFLATNPGRVFTRRQLLVEVWHSNSEWQQEATVTEHIRRLRRKIEADHNRPQLIMTVRGVGYRFERRSKASQRPTIQVS